MMLLMIKRGLMFGSALSLFVALMLRRIPQVSQDVRAGDDPLILYVMLVFTIQLSFLLIAERLFYSTTTSATSNGNTASTAAAVTEPLENDNSSRSSEIAKKVTHDAIKRMSFKDVIVACGLGAIAVAIGFDYIRKYNPELLYGFSNRSGGNAMVAAIIDIMAIEFKSKWFHEITQIGFYLLFGLGNTLVFVVTPLYIVKIAFDIFVFVLRLFIPFNGLLNFDDENENKGNKLEYKISMMEKIHNFRDVAKLNHSLDIGEGRKIKKGKLYRCASPHYGSPNDLAKLKELNIKFIVDLRQPDERETDDVLEYHKEFKRINDRMKDEELIEIALKKHPIRVGWSLANLRASAQIIYSTGLQKMILYISLPKLGSLLHRNVHPYLPSPLSYLLQIVFTLPLSVGVPSRVLGANFAATYYAFAKHNKEDIRSILTIATHLFENDSAMLIHCVSGKDRTGTIVGLILLAAGVPVEYAREDYHLSHVYGLSHENFTEVMKRPAPSPLWMKEEEVQTLFGARKELFDQFVGYILDDYGTMENYFDSIGFDKTMRERLRKALIESD